LSGIQNGTGLSGSTGWNNSVRSRLYLRRVIQGEDEPNPDARVLETMKANYAATGAEIALTWRNGVFEADPAETGLDRMARRSKAMRKFMELLRMLRQQGRDVNSRSGPNYAPSVFAAHPEAEGITKGAFREAMEILFTQEAIQNVQIMRDRKPTTVIQEAK
ncbi:MAG: ATPase, partial [Paracoccus sp. (in: a-proteobacteria)]